MPPEKIFVAKHAVQINYYPDKWGSIKWGTISSSTKDTCKVKSKPINMIFCDPATIWNDIKHNHHDVN